ncbi:neuroglobin-like [Orbicella faveolata]|uniref:neuroglobin-like n=1 Tax=Orbicella faveolata TaxID=48498 RepID=UPI0009E2B9EB|nr:neuroglobin-like [Orbicella faveolata]
MFSFRDLANSTEDAMRTDDRFKRQGLVTMQHVDLAVASLSDLGSIVPALKDLGARHSMYKVEEYHFGPVGAALLGTLDMGLGEKFTPEVKEAWTVVYGIVADTMKAGLKEVLEG